MEVLEKNWSLIDTDDVEPFALFRVDCTRAKVEIVEEKGKGVPFGIKQRLGPVTFLRPEFVELVTRRWKEKRERLDCLLGVRREFRRARAAKPKK
jgi:hypothetical protein